MSPIRAILKVKPVAPEEVREVIAAVTVVSDEKDVVGLVVVFGLFTVRWLRRRDIEVSAKWKGAFFRFRTRRDKKEDSDM